MYANKYESTCLSFSIIHSWLTSFNKNNNFNFTAFVYRSFRFFRCSFWLFEFPFLFLIVWKVLFLLPLCPSAITWFCICFILCPLTNIWSFQMSKVDFHDCFSFILLFSWSVVYLQSLKSSKSLKKHLLRQNLKVSVGFSLRFSS